MEKKTKPERLTVPYPMRFKPSQKALLDRAAEASGMSVADILRTGGMAEARRLLRAAKGDEG